MDYTTAPLPELHRELSDLEGKVTHLRAVIAARNPETAARPSNAITLRDGRHHLATMSTDTGRIAHADTIVTDC